MLEGISQFWSELSATEIAVGIIGFLAAMVVSYAVVMVILVKMPANYFQSDREHHFLPDTHPVLRTILIVLKNIVGVVLVLTGIVLSFPAVPGPGILTVFIGLMITDIPGKRRIEAIIIQRPAVLSLVNKLRAKYKKPALVLD
jgi:uncharacterized membrane protein YphA (DoxX/SURF4 family)